MKVAWCAFVRMQLMTCHISSFSRYLHKQLAIVIWTARDTSFAIWCSKMSKAIWIGRWVSAQCTRVIAHCHTYQASRLAVYSQALTLNRLSKSHASALPLNTITWPSILQCKTNVTLPYCIQWSNYRCWFLLRTVTVIFIAINKYRNGREVMKSNHPFLSVLYY